MQKNTIFFAFCAICTIFVANETAVDTCDAMDGTAQRVVTAVV